MATTKLEASKKSRVIGHQFGDGLFKWLSLMMALAIFALLLLIIYELLKGSRLSIHHFGWHFLANNNAANDNFGAWPAIYGTLVSSAIALIIAVPISIATAVFLTDLAPKWMRQPFTVFIEMLAAIPSVILGLWGVSVMLPFLRDHLDPILQKWFGTLPLFKGPILGLGYLAAGIILAIMIMPIITSIAREIIRSVPDLQREAAYALGATRWEVTRLAVLSYAKKGLAGAVILGLGRALGETMAVTMLIGNYNHTSSSLFALGVTLSSAVASQFNGTLNPLHLSALIELGLVLLGITFIVNVLAQLLLKVFAGPTVKPQH